MDSAAAIKPVTSKKSRSVLSRFRAEKSLHLMIWPGIIWMLVFCYVPMAGILLAFTDYNIARPIFQAPWVGFKHFIEFFTDEHMPAVFINTLGISFFKLLIGFSIPIILAILLNEIRNTRFKKIVQTISYLPHFISWVILGGIMMSWMSETGLITKALVALKIVPAPTVLLGEPGYFWQISVISDIWKELGWSAIIYIAAIAGIDQEMYEAATVDGAGRFRKIWHITLPNLKPTIAILFILACSGIMGSNFDQIFMLKNNLNAAASDTIDIYVYRMGIANGRVAYATAVGLFKSAVSLLLLLLANRVTRSLTDTSLF